MMLHLLFADSLVSYILWYGLAPIYQTKISEFWPSSVIICTVDAAEVLALRPDPVIILAASSSPLSL